MLLFGPLAGVIADTFDRKRLLLAVTFTQLASRGGTGVGGREQTSRRRSASFAAVLVGGVANAVFMPAYSAVLPFLVGPDDLPGAISLQSAQMNLSRVIGPAIGGVAFAAVGPSWVFLGNAASYLFVIAALLQLHLPHDDHRIEDENERGFRRLTSGFRIARRDPVIGRALITIATFSGLCLLWVGQFPVLRRREPRPRRGLARLRPSLRLLRYRRRSSVRSRSAPCFAESVEGDARPPGVPRLRRLPRHLLACCDRPSRPIPSSCSSARPTSASVTALNTAMQSRLANHERGRVMALWMMGFGGVVSVANLVLRHRSSTPSACPR